MADKTWTLISKTVKDHIEVPPTATVDNITRNLNNAKNDWKTIAKIVNKYKVKNGTQNSVIQRIRDIKSGKITSLSQITGGGSTSGGGSSDGSDDSSSSGDTSSDGGGGSGDSGPLNSTVNRVPITDRDEAMDFALTEWNKIRRTSGHSIECQVFGSNYWQVGEWCKVYIPSLNEYTDMYITKVDHSNDSGSEWLTNITLMDYAPSISQLESEDVTKADSNSEGTDGASADGTSGDGTEGASGKWTQIAKILQTYYEKPSGGWDNVIRAVQSAKVYDPDIRNQITPLKKKKGQENKSYVDVGHELCNVVGIGY